MSAALMQLEDPETLRSILESVQAGVYVLDTQRKVLLWSDGAERLSGYLRHEIVGREQRLLLFCQQSCGLCEPASEARHAPQDGVTRESHLHFRHKDGHRITMRIWSTTMRSPSGHVLGFTESFEEVLPGLRSRVQPELATHGCLDEQTEVPNHRFTDFHLRESLSAFYEYGLPFSVLLMRLDALAQTRIACGKEAERSVLRLVSQSIHEAIRPSDFFGRWGENEFLILANDCGHEGLKTVVDRLHALGSSFTFRWWGDVVSIPCSLGQSTVVSDDTSEALLDRAAVSMARIPVMNVAHSASATAGSGI